MDFNDYLKTLFGEKQTMTLEELTAAAADNKNAKFVNLQDGGYVDAQKYNALQGQLTTANITLQNLKDTVKKFDGVDVGKLQDDVENWEKKYNKDIYELKCNSAIDMALIGKKARNPKTVRALLKMDDIKLEGENLLGLDAQIESLMKTDAYLFEPQQSESGKNPGVSVGSGGGHGISTNSDYEKMSDDEYYTAIKTKGENK